MAKYDGAVVAINNWKRYNPREDSKYPSWFRCENNFFFSPTFSDLDAEEVCAALFLICEVSRKNGEPYRIKTSFMARSARVSGEKVTSALDKLMAEGFCSETRATSCESVQAHPNSPTTDGRTDERNEQNVPDPVFARESWDRDEDTGPGPGTGIGLRPWGTGSGAGTQEPEPLDFTAPELVGSAPEFTDEALASPAPEPPPPPGPAPAPASNVLPFRPRSAPPPTPEPPPPEPVAVAPRAPDRPPPAAPPAPAQSVPRRVITPRPAPPPPGPHAPVFRTNPERDWGAMPDIVRRFSRSWREPLDSPVTHPEEESA